MTIERWRHELESRSLSDLEYMWELCDNIRPDETINGMCADTWVSLIYSILSSKRAEEDQTMIIYDSGKMDIGGNHARLIVRNTPKGIAVTLQHIDDSPTITEYYRHGTYYVMPLGTTHLSIWLDWYKHMHDHTCLFPRRPYRTVKI